MMEPSDAMVAAGIAVLPNHPDCRTPGAESDEGVEAILIGATDCRDLIKKICDAMERVRMSEICETITIPPYRLAVLGDMLELGDEAEQHHLNLAATINPLVSAVIAVGPMMRIMYDALPEHLRVSWHPTSEDAIPSVLEALEAHPGAVCLVKGSRGMEMDRIVDAIEARMNRKAAEYRNAMLSKADGAHSDAIKGG